MEITMIIGIIVYFLNFFTGKAKNQKIANQVKRGSSFTFTHYEIFQTNLTPQWFAAHRPLLESQFSLVGDDGNKVSEFLSGQIFNENYFQDMTEIQEPLTKESENLFSFWCSGRWVSIVAAFIQDST